VDKALTLRINIDQGNELSDTAIAGLLKSSNLVSILTENFKAKPKYAIWRIIALSEIPYAYKLEYVGHLISYIEKYLATPSGFTLTGKETDLFPCYNAMLLEAFAKLGYESSEVAQNAVGWIKKYQPFERNAPTSWTGKGVQKAVEW
jgi:hypothetical protein